MAAAANRIATVAIGPQAGGRGYRVLARSDGPAIPAAAEGRLSEMALVLAGWAEERDAPAAALVPLTEATAPALLMRFAYLGSASLGTLAYANGLILDAAAFALCGGRPEALLPLIPPPDGSRRFAEAPLALPASPPPAPPLHDWTGLGLEWRDRLVLVGDVQEEEPVLASILRSIGPAGPGARVRGWATTALLPASGSFAPGRELQLLVVDVGRRRPASLHHLPAHATATGFDGDRVDLPPAARAWERLKSLGARDLEIAEAVGPLRWSPDRMDAAPADVIGPAAGEALRGLSGAARVRLLLCLAAPRGDGLDAAFAATARAWFGQLVGRGSLEPQHAAFYLKALVDGDPAATAAMAPLGPLLLHPGTGRWLGGATFGRLLALGYAEALAARAEEAPALLAGLGGAELRALATSVARLPARPPVLLSALARAAADAGETAALGPMIDERFAAPAGADERLLAARSVVGAVHAAAPRQMARLARRALHLRRGEKMSPGETLDMLGATLEWVRLKGAPA